MKTIVLASQKGGAGKTTLAAHLASPPKGQGTALVLIDTTQASLAAWWNEREDETPSLPRHPERAFRQLEALGRQGMPTPLSTRPRPLPSPLRLLWRRPILFLFYPPEPARLAGRRQHRRTCHRRRPTLCLCRDASQANARLTVQAMAPCRSMALSPRPSFMTAWTTPLR